MYAGDRPEVALSLQIHASCLRQLGDIERRRELYEQARELHEQALAMYERLFGRDVEEVDVAWNLIALAADLRELGDVRQARELDGQALGVAPTTVRR